MALKADHISGGFFLFFGLAIYFWAIPNYAETVQGGKIAPATYPKIISIIIAAAGAILVLRPTTHMGDDPRHILRAGVFAILLAVGAYGMSWFGFEFVAPALALAIMWLIGERRPIWLFGGVVCLPLVIWVIVAYALDRALP